MELRATKVTRIISELHIVNLWPNTLRSLRIRAACTRAEIHEIGFLRFIRTRAAQAQIRSGLLPVFAFRARYAPRALPRLE